MVPLALKLPLIFICTCQEVIDLLLNRGQLVLDGCRGPLTLCKILESLVELACNYGILLFKEVEVEIEHTFAILACAIARSAGCG